MQNKNIIYVVPDLLRVSGGPSTRISLFKKEFLNRRGSIIEKGNKLRKSLKFQKLNLTYVESATNRISFFDFICLIALRVRSKEVVVFIRDIYIELFPDDYKSIRSKITLIANKLSNLFLTIISTKLAFPTKEMGKVFFDKHPNYPKREYFPLPPGTRYISEDRKCINLEKKVGLLYLGSVSYQNSGFESFINFANTYKTKYNYFVLSGDKNAKSILKDYSFINLSKVNHSEIERFISYNNIAFGFHTRPRNFYDDVTFPIKVLDFISLQLPFLTERHKPIVKLLGQDYKLFVNVKDSEQIEELISKYLIKSEYENQLCFLKTIANSNTYSDRYEQLFK